MTRLLDQVGHDVDTGSLAARVGLLPTGSVEYHGPHGPLGTDTFIAREIAERVGATRPHLLVMPELAYMPCPPETRRHTGTLHIAPSVASALLEQLFREVLRAGLAGVIVLNAHVPNVGPASLAADAVGDEFPDAFFALVSWWETLPADETAALAGFSENGGHGHGGALEMSVTAAIVPDLVRPELAEDVGAEGMLGDTVHVIRPPEASIPPRGYHGRPSEIDRDHGATLLELAAQRIGAAIDALLGRVG